MGVCVYVNFDNDHACDKYVNIHFLSKELNLLIPVRSKHMLLMQQTATHLMEKKRKMHFKVVLLS